MQPFSILSLKQQIASAVSFVLRRYSDPELVEREGNVLPRAEGPLYTSLGQR
jgi:hypothetical protein